MQYDPCFDMFWLDYVCDGDWEMIRAQIINESDYSRWIGVLCHSLPRKLGFWLRAGHHGVRNLATSGTSDT